MNLTQLQLDLEASRRRTEAMGLDPQDSHVTSDLALAELAIAHEELCLCERELRTQYEKLCDAHESLEKLHAADREHFEHAPDPLLITDMAGTVLDANQAMLDLLNADSRSVAGMPLIDFLPGLDLLDVRHGLARLAAGEPTARWNMSVNKHRTSELVVLSVQARRGAQPAPTRHGARVANGFRVIRWSMHDITAQTVAASAREADYMILAKENALLQAAVSRLRSGLTATPASLASPDGRHRLILGLVETAPMPIADVVRLCADLVLAPRNGISPPSCDAAIGELLARELVRIDDRARLVITSSGRSALNAASSDDADSRAGDNQAR